MGKKRRESGDSGEERGIGIISTCVSSRRNVVSYCYSVLCHICSFVQSASPSGVPGAEGEHQSEESRLCLQERVREVPQKVK